MKTTFLAERAAREEHAALGLDYVQAEGEENPEPQATLLKGMITRRRRPNRRVHLHGDGC
jgi:hypothetical protein